jgi:hypothetical protein
MSSFWSASSANLSLAWSLGNGGKGRFPLKFPLNLAWYHEQKCKQFRSLQHRKERGAGFQHEFIVLILLDNSICRLERMGDPSARFDALSAQGSVAHDVAQYFTSDKLSEACLGTSDIVAEITFPYDLDLIDVLRVCRAIHEGEKTCNYTLRSFNCYFFALAIQSVLTRRVVVLGEGVSDDTWISSIRSGLGTLSDMYEMPLSARGEQPTFLRIYSLLQPDIQWPRDDLLESLETRLSGSELFRQVHKGWSTMLWHSNIALAIDHILDNRIRDVMVHVWQTNMQNFDMNPDDQLHTSDMGSKLANDQCRTQLNQLVSQAAFLHEQVSRTSRLSQLEQYMQIFRAFELLSSETSKKLPDLGFRRISNPQSSPILTAACSSSNTQQVLIWLRYGKDLLLWCFHLVLGLFWIVPLELATGSRGMVVEDELAPTLAMLEDPGYSSTTNVQRIAKKLHTLCTAQESVIWYEWPWAHIREPIRQRILESVLDQEKPLLEVRLQVSPTIPYHRTISTH